MNTVVVVLWFPSQETMPSMPPFLHALALGGKDSYYEKILNYDIIGLNIIMDNKTPLQRKKNMTAVKSKDTKPELMLRKFLFSRGFRYRVNVKTLSGTPDIVLSKYKTAILVNGCFWHGHEGCKKAELPATNTDFWRKKIENAKKHDLLVIRKLENQGWNVIICWECEILHKQPELVVVDNIFNIGNYSVACGG